MLAPVIILKGSPARWLTPPVPADAMLIRPGLVFA
jgi:hypothetical protein